MPTDVNKQPTSQQVTQTAESAPPAGNAPAATADAGQDKKQTATPPAPPADAGAPPPGDAEPKDPWSEVGDGRDAQDADLAASKDSEYAAAAGFGDGAKIDPIAIGDGRELDADDQRFMLPHLRAAGVPAEQAGAAMKAFAAVQAAAMKADADQYRADTAKIWEEVRKEYGPALKQVLTDAERGARRIFPADLWEEIRNVPALALDRRFLSAMAKVGGIWRNDSGGPATQQGASKPADGRVRFDLDAWAKGNMRT